MDLTVLNILLMWFNGGIFQISLIIFIFCLINLIILKIKNIITDKSFGKILSLSGILCLFIALNCNNLFITIPNTFNINLFFNSFIYTGLDNPVYMDTDIKTHQIFMIIRYIIIFIFGIACTLLSITLQKKINKRLMKNKLIFGVWSGVLIFTLLMKVFNSLGLTSGIFSYIEYLILLITFILTWKIYKKFAIK